jgi:hypothetical protein
MKIQNPVKYKIEYTHNKTYYTFYYKNHIIGYSNDFDGAFKRVLESPNHEVQHLLIYNHNAKAYDNFKKYEKELDYIVLNTYINGIIDQGKKLVSILLDINRIRFYENTETAK